MRPAFLLNANSQPVSTLVPKGDEGGLTIGTAIELVKPFRTPYGMLPAGTKGFVDFVDDESGLVEFRMEGWEPALVHWENLLIVVPFQTEELCECIKAIFPARRTTTQLMIEKTSDNPTQLSTA